MFYESLLKNRLLVSHRDRGGTAPYPTRSQVSKDIVETGYQDERYDRCKQNPERQ